MPLLEDLVARLAALQISVADITEAWHVEIVSVHDAASLHYTRRAAQTLALVSLEVWRQLTELNTARQRVADRPRLLAEINQALCTATQAATIADIAVFPPVLESGGLHQLRPRDASRHARPQPDAASIFRLDAVVYSMAIHDHGE